MKNEINPSGVHPGMRPMAELLGLLGDLAVEQAARAARRRVESRRVRRGATLRPGPETALWNALVDHVRSHLHRRGEKANLARLLEVPRQRVNEYFVSRTMMPDAERLLHVLAWLTARTAPEALQKLPKPVH
jgi:hypothetical protein